MGLDLQRVVRLSLTIFLLFVLFALGTNREFYLSSMVSAYLSLALCSALIILVMIRRSWADAQWVALGAVVLAGLDYRVMHFHPFFMAGFSFVGLAALATLGTRTIWANMDQRTVLLYAFLPAVLFVASEWMASTLLDITEALHPKTFDLFLYSFDSSLHVQISFLMGQVFSRWLWLRFACLAIYIALPLPLALVYAAQLRRARQGALQVMTAFLVTGPIGVLCYNMLPACGPVHLFGSAFPWHPLSSAETMHLNLIPIVLKGARNAIPSLHMTWVLLIWMNSKGLRLWVRAIALVFLVLTLLATLGTGEHYFVDLVVAFPFSLLVQALCSYSIPLRSPERRFALLFGAFTTLVWLALLSFSTNVFWMSPVVPWFMIAATVLPSIFFWHRLMNPEVQEKLITAKAAVASAGA
jgi:hypothetical protein